MPLASIPTLGKVATNATSLRVAIHIDGRVITVTKRASKKDSGSNGGATLGFEAQMFLAADKLRKNLEPSDYKHVALGLIFLKHISTAFEARHAALLAEDADSAEDPDEYAAENVFWVPQEARWTHLQANAKQPTIGKLIDEAMAIKSRGANWECRRT